MKVEGKTLTSVPSFHSCFDAARNETNLRRTEMATVVVNLRSDQLYNHDRRVWHK
jgi:hypothetical protein